jgi:G3E family GTPase
MLHADQRSPVPLTVIGGYLGAGKTTLVNRLLLHPAGRRIGVVVNDFGSIGIDAQLLESASNGAGGRIVSLPNGCVCCTVGSGLHEALAALLALDPSPDHVVIEVSGVADPAMAAAWATVPPFAPGGVVVLAAADSVRSMVRDRYVGEEVLRQLVGADLIVLTKTDLCDPTDVAVVGRWLDEVTAGVPRVSADHGVVPTSVVLGAEPTAGAIGGAVGIDLADHTERYVAWEWALRGGVGRADLDTFLDGVPAGVLRLKGFVVLDDGSRAVVQRVGNRATVEPTSVLFDLPGALVAILRRDPAEPDASSDLDRLTHLAQTLLS